MTKKERLCLDNRCCFNEQIKKTPGKSVAVLKFEGSEGFALLIRRKQLFLLCGGKGRKNKVHKPREGNGRGSLG